MSEDRGPTAIVRRVLPARPDVVFDQWIDAEALAEFITPSPARSGRVEVDPRVGGSFSIEMVDVDGTVRIVGRYLELERPRRIRFTWQSTLGGGFDSVVTIDFEPHGASETVMTIEHSLLPPAWREDHQRGWIRIGEQLDAALRGPTNGI
jgi:uncharacterized protein YndB with AHSA1/START domain